MKITLRRALLLASLVATAIALVALLPGSAQSDETTPANEVLAAELAEILGVEEFDKQPDVSGGAETAVFESTDEFENRIASAGPAGALRVSTPGTEGCQNRFLDEATGRFNIRVNQDCSLRRQAEEVIAINPNNPRNLVAGQNDSRIGFNHCGYDWSFNLGRSWGDQVPPFWQYLLPGNPAINPPHTSDACSDPTAAFDAQGNVYAGGILFDINTPASAVVVVKSNNPFGGAFYHIPRPLPFQIYRTDLGRAANLGGGVVVEDNNPAIFHDKELMATDRNPFSPKANNVYMTWTRFEAVGPPLGAISPIFFSQSTNGGADWSTPIEISGVNPDICTAFTSAPGRCDADQGSHPYVGRDGTVYVAFGNGNTPELGENQVLVVKCPVNRDCADPASWTQPVKVGDLIGKHPIGVPGDPSGCPPGRQCIPPNGYRAPEFTSISISVDNRNRAYVSWFDTRNLQPPCIGPAGEILTTLTASPPCDTDIFYAFSTDGGATWSDAIRVTPEGNAQWQPWSEVTADGNKLAIAYYDRSYGNCETEGCNDITLAEVQNPATESPTIEHVRITTESMPNLTLENNPVQAGFLGDYLWVATDRLNRAHIVWADTRGRGIGSAPEEDIYYARHPQ
jgi:hypothetical protein